MEAVSGNPGIETGCEPPLLAIERRLVPGAYRKLPAERTFWIIDMIFWVSFSLGAGDKDAIFLQ